ncbi:hypothetical protein THRCLA_22662 [Thraustotheca clavata]|uniref:Secreted protein n=1 Tax=Thraustotheca clavata TaxID=74557 RepID=A0A1V9YV50_9STRA|nr:hypothetical protein THRCLA_22662 [Thraustotheca clavata]
MKPTTFAFAALFAFVAADTAPKNPPEGPNAPSNIHNLSDKEARAAGLPDPNGEFEICRSVCTKSPRGGVCRWRCF